MPALLIADVVSTHIDELRELANQDFPDAVLHFVYAKGVSPGSATRVKQVLLTHGIDIDVLRLTYAAPELRSVASLLDSGWTKALIARYLGPPDVFKANHRFSGAARTRYYDGKRVAAVAGQPEVVAAMKLAAKRVEAGHSVAEARRCALLVQVQQVAVAVAEVSLDELLEAAIVTHNENDEDLQYARHGSYDWIPVNEESDPGFLAQIQVTHLLQKLSNYDQVSFKLSRKPGSDEALVALKMRFLDAIESLYPHLGDEVARQRFSPDERFD